MWNSSKAEESSLLWSTNNSGVLRKVASESTYEVLRGGEDLDHREIFSLRTWQ